MVTTDYLKYEVGLYLLDLSLILLISVLDTLS